MNACSQAGLQFDYCTLIATFRGPGGFTQIAMSKRQAQNIATALGVPFTIKGGSDGQAEAEAQAGYSGVVDAADREIG